jgi:hypothetical protein
LDDPGSVEDSDTGSAVNIIVWQNWYATGRLYSAVKPPADSLLRNLGIRNNGQTGQRGACGNLMHGLPLTVTGTYTIRVHAYDYNPSWIGGYTVSLSFTINSADYNLNHSII